MQAITRNIGNATAPSLPIQTVRNRLLQALWRALDRLVPKHPDRHNAPPPEFFDYPPFLSGRLRTVAIARSAATKQSLPRSTGDGG